MAAALMCGPTTTKAFPGPRKSNYPPGGGPLKSIQAFQVSVCMTPSESVALLTVDPHFPSSCFKPTPFSRSKFSSRGGLNGLLSKTTHLAETSGNFHLLAKDEQTPAPIFWSKLVPTSGVEWPMDRAREQLRPFGRNLHLQTSGHWSVMQ